MGSSIQTPGSTSIWNACSTSGHSGSSGACQLGIVGLLPMRLNRRGECTCGTNGVGDGMSRWDRLLVENPATQGLELFPVLAGHHCPFLARRAACAALLALSFAFAVNAETSFGPRSSRRFGMMMVAPSEMRDARRVKRGTNCMVLLS